MKNNFWRTRLDALGRSIARPVLAPLLSRHPELRYDLRSWRELGVRGKLKFVIARWTRAYRVVYEKERPLVSVCIATYNRARLLTQRSLKSVCNQTYDNLQIVV